MDDPNKVLKYQIFLTLKLWLVLLNNSVEYVFLDTDVSLSHFLVVGISNPEQWSMLIDWFKFKCSGTSWNWEIISSYDFINLQRKYKTEKDGRRTSSPPGKKIKCFKHNAYLKRDERHQLKCNNQKIRFRMLECSSYKTVENLFFFYNTNLFAYNIPCSTYFQSLSGNDATI